MFQAIHCLYIFLGFSAFQNAFACSDTNKSVDQVPLYEQDRVLCLTCKRHVSYTITHAEKAEIWIHQNERKHSIPKIPKDIQTCIQSFTPAKDEKCPIKYLGKRRRCGNSQKCSCICYMEPLCNTLCFAPTHQDSPCCSWIPALGLLLTKCYRLLALKSVHTICCCCTPLECCPQEHYCQKICLFTGGCCCCLINVNTARYDLDRWIDLQHQIIQGKTKMGYTTYLPDDAIIGAP